MTSKNPFVFGIVGSGHETQVFDAHDRINMVSVFGEDQCRAALDVPRLQATVRRAVERRRKYLAKHA